MNALIMRRKGVRVYLETVNGALKCTIKTEIGCTYENMMFALCKAVKIDKRIAGVTL